MTAPRTETARETAASLASEITDIVTARGANYGPPEENFANIAGFWRAWIKARYAVDIPLDAADAGHMSALIKTARLARTPTHRDSALDGAIYTMLGHGCSVSVAGPTVDEIVTRWHIHGVTKHDIAPLWPIDPRTIV